METKKKKETLLELKGVNHSYALSSGQKIKVLKDINLTVESGEVLALLGPSGSGKSTCLRIFAGLLDPTFGTAFRGGEPLSGPNPDIALVFQNFALLPWLTVFENVAVGIEPLALPGAEVKERVERALDLVGLEGFETAYPKELSGGMKQRVGIARALVMERPVLCLDEPFSALDVLTAETLRREVLNLWLSGKTRVKSIILVTHNILEAVSMGGRIVVMGINPGHIRINVKNDLPYPRDEKSGVFRALMDDVHDVITQAFNPDTPDWVPPSLSASSIASIPPVNVNQMIGLLELIDQQGGRADAFVLAQALNRDSVQVILLAKGAELLDLVDTPKNAIVITDLGKKFLAGDVNVKKTIFHQKLLQLQLVKMIREKLEKEPDHEIEKDLCLNLIREWLPNEPAEQVLDSLIQWGRYGEVFGYRATDHTLFHIESSGGDKTL